jgi:hypothetical protein
MRFYQAASGGGARHRIYRTGRFGILRLGVSRDDSVSHLGGMLRRGSWCGAVRLAPAWSAGVVLSLGYAQGWGCTTDSNPYVASHMKAERWRTVIPDFAPPSLRPTTSRAGPGATDGDAEGRMKLPTAHLRTSRPMIRAKRGRNGNRGEPPLRPVNRRLAPTQVRILVLPPAPRPAQIWSPSGPGHATRRAQFRSCGRAADTIGHGGPRGRRPVGANCRADPAG